MTQKNKIYKDIKPVEADIHLKYICPECGANHWLSLKENKINGYKILCEYCDSILKVKQIEKLKFKFKEEKQEVIKQEPTSLVEENEGVDFLEKSDILLESYGFSKAEAITMIDDAFSKTHSRNINTLVKTAIFDIGVKNDSFSQATEV
jgi:DNA-directed RNA polymerase subunit RPC12/RpoP